MAVDLFSVPVFLIILRETLETAIIVSVLLAFLKQTLDGPNQDVKVYNALRRQVWLGTAAGFGICLLISAVIITLFYTLGKDSWGMNENYYEGAFALLASLIITVMGAALLRIGKMQQKWRLKLARALENPISTTTTGRSWVARSLEKYAMFILPFVTVLREGVEAVVFIAGVSFQAPPSAVPLPVVVGLACGSLVGWLLYKGGSSAKLQYFLVASTCLLYLVAAGLFSRSIWHFEQQKWNEYIGGEAEELGAGPGSYDIDKSVWHVNCCSPTVPDAGGWGIFTAVLGWTNSATYGSVISYNVYWICVMAGFITMKFHETKGHYPFMKPKAQPAGDGASVSRDEDSSTIHGDEDDVADLGDVPDELDQRRVSVASM